MPGGHSEREPPDPIPNSEVKTLCADGSVPCRHARVGHCQALNRNPRGREISGVLSFGPRRGRADCSKRLVHDQRIDKSQCWMLKRSRQSAYYLKSKCLPKPHGALIRGDDKVKLHGTIAARSSMLQRVQAHRPRDATPSGSRPRHVAAIAYMATAAGLVRAHVIRADDNPVGSCNKRLLVGSKPV